MDSGGLQSGLKRRHVTMISLGGVIGAGFVVGWLYWYFWVIVLAVEAAAGAAIIQEWLPGVPIWASSLVLMLLLTGTNLISVRAFGEFEFWFASIKVAAIVAFIVIAVVYVVTGGGLGQLTANDGFVPKGGLSILSGIVIVIFAFVGAE